MKQKGLKSVRTALQQATRLNPTNANAWENLALLHEYDAQSKMMQARQGKKDASELERQLGQLAAAAAEARSNAREAEAILQGFSDP